MKTALLVEDHDATAQWLVEVVQDCFTGIAIDRAASLARTWEKIDSAHYGLALIDIGLPDGSGLEIVKVLAERHAETYIVVTTIFDDDEHLFKALALGAHGYLLKEENPQQIAAQLRGIVKGIPPLSPAIARRILKSFQRKPVKVQSAPDHKEAATLTKRETEVLSLIAKGCTRKDVAEILGITPNTASDYIKRTYSKLSINSRAEAALTAVRMGLVDNTSG